MNGGEKRPRKRALPVWAGRLLCLLGLHDYRLVESVGSFGFGGRVEKVECRRCGYVTTRHGDPGDHA